MVPILCGVHFYKQNSLVWNSIIDHTAFEYWLGILVEDGHFIWLLAFFAFINNFAREIIKDIQDVKGDPLINAKTLPIKIGIRKSKIWVGLLLLLPLLFFGSLFLWHQGEITYSIQEQLLVFIPVGISFLFNLISIASLYRARQRSELKFADRWVKLSMIVGIFTPIYWYIFWL